jgi:hypothetical protein
MAVVRRDRHPEAAKVIVVLANKFLDRAAPRRERITVADNCASAIVGDVWRL